MAAYVSQELRPMKKQRIGPPDIYPQDAKQKEDELTSTSVKLGFSNIPHFNDEYGSAKNANISQEKYGTCYSTIISKRLEINTFQDSSKKKQQLMKDNFWPVTTQRRSQMEAWFKDLAGNKPLSVLSRRVPSFNKKEEIFTTLCEFSVPIMKAAWFIKMTAAHNTAMQENKTKKRQIVDQSVDWTNALTKFMREQLQKVQDHYHGSTSGPATSFLTATQPPSQVDLDLALKQWHYCSRLARHMYDEGLLDRHEFLSWFIETMEKMKQTDDTVLKLLLSQVLQYMDEITMTAQLSRRLGHLCGKKLSQLVNESGCSSPRTQSPMLNNTANSAINNSGNNQLLPQNPLAAVFTEYNNCPQHRGIVLSLSAILQIITLMCPSALVWNNLGEGKSSSPYCGSPLDLLPCAPSSLPMPPNPQNQQIRAQIRVLEHQIILRSRAAELRWSSDKCQQSTAGFTISKVLDVLDTLDRHNFNKVEVNNCLESLYNKIFSINQNKEGNEPLVSDDPIINLLIDWAVSTQRHGAHRSIVVAKLLEKRQHDLRQEKYMESDMMDDKESLGSDAMVPPTVPSFQNLLMHYLDTKAPVLDENSSDENRQAFANLVHLFSELICLDVFSHDAYMCTLISRGELTSSPSVATLSADSVDLSSIKSQVESIKHEHQDDIKVDMDLHTMDLQSLFGPVKDDNRFSPECPPSVKSVKSEKEQPVPSVGKSDPVPPPLPPPIHEPKGPSRHMLYATHFPIPQDENSSHECNQRMIVLFFVGKDRDTTRHVSRKVSKEILKLYSKKNCIDISSGDLGKTKKKKEKEGEIPVLALTSSNFESIFAKFQKLSYYDQHAVAYQCATSVIEQINSFTSGNSSYLPLVENIAYMFDLMEYSLNIRNLLEFSIKLLTEMQKVEASLMEMNSSLSGNYTTNLCLYIVGIFRKYHSYLIVSEDMTTQAFEGLIGVVKHVCNPADCTSAERCILAYLYDVYNPCCYLRAKFYEMFYNVTDAYSKIRLTLYAEITPAASNLLWDPHFMREVINNVKTQPDNQLIKQLNEVPASRYSFVCNAMLELCISQGVEKLNEISILCAELTARCNSLSAEWLGVLKALCCSSNHSCGFIDVLTQIDVSDLSIHDSLAVFVSILIARHCFSLQDFIQHVALPSLMAPAAFAEHGDQDAEPGARLTCHLLLCLFKIPRSVHSPHQTTGHKGVGNIRASCDRHLLAAAHDNIDTGAFLAVLKANLVLGDSCSDKAKSKGSTGKKDENRGDIISTLLNSLDDELGIDMMLGSGKGGMENAGLGEFSKHSLKEMCGQDWVREKFLQDPESLLTSEGLLDSMLTPEQAELLVEMICYPNGVPNQIDCSEPENSEIIERILGTLDQWTLRVSLLELNLMFKLAATTAETNSILDNIAEETIQLFYQQSENIKNQDSGLGEGMSTQTRNEADKDNCVWMVAPLISKLPSTVQGRVLKLAGQVLESSNNLVASKSKQDKERNQRSKSLLSHQPFLSLILTCLKGQDEQREGLLLSLLNQLEKCIANFKEMLEKYPDEGKIRSNIHETLQLRLFLVGGMFDTIQRNTSSTMEWGQLLVQLISSGVVDLQSNYELFTTVLDMLNALLLGTLVPDLSEKGDDNKKTHSNLVKKLRKELGDKYFEATDKIRQLFPLPKKFFEIVTVEPHGSLVDTKGNKIAGFDSIGRKQGLQVGKKEKISPWEVIEGVKNPPPLSWTFFGAIRLEKKPLKYEEQHRLLLYHTHCLNQPLSHFLEAPPLPPEDLEPAPEKAAEEKPREQTDTPAVETGKKHKPPRRRRQSRAAGSTYTQPAPIRQFSGYQDPMYQQTPPNWYGPPNLAAQQQIPQYTFPQPTIPPGGGGPRFGTPQYSSKQAIQSMLRSRQPMTGSGYMPPNQQALHSMQLMQKQRQQFVRHRLQQFHQNQQQNRLAETQGMYGNTMPQGNPQTPGMHPMSQQAAPMQQFSQGYGNMPAPQNTAMMDTMNSGMMTQKFTPPYTSQNPGMMQQTMPQQPGYISQPSQQSQPPYNPSTRMPPTMGTSGMQNPASTMTGMGGYNQMGSSGPAQPQGGAGYMQHIPNTQQQQQQQHRFQQYRQHQMMAAMQPNALQPNQQQMQTQQKTTAALVAQLQRQMGVPTHPGAPAQAQAPAPQYSYQRTPPQY